MWGARAVLLAQSGLEGGFGGGEGQGHGFEAGDFELEGLPFGVVGVAADGANCFLKEGFRRQLGELLLQSAEAGAFSREHVLGCF